MLSKCCDVVPDRLNLLGVEYHAKKKIAKILCILKHENLVCAAFSVSRADGGVDLCDPVSELRLETAPDEIAPAVRTGPRVGIDYAPEPWRGRPWRFFVPGSPALSMPSDVGRRVAG